MTHSLIAFGECMVELARVDGNAFQLAFGGDTFNTAVYFARLTGAPTAYATALGTDPYSDAIASLAADNGISDALILRMPDHMPGLYLIETAEGERAFHYWRSAAAVRRFIAESDLAALQHAAGTSRFIYLSGITLSLFDADDRKRLRDVVSHARSAGTTVVMDSNYRPRGWPDGVEQAREAFAAFWEITDLALPTFDDEQALWGDDSVNDTLKRLMAFGVGRVVVKDGANGAHIWEADGTSSTIAVEQTVQPIDTTAAGDSFNAGVMAALHEGHSLAESAVTGHRIASAVIQHRGAIVPTEATQPVVDAFRNGCAAR